MAESAEMGDGALQNQNSTDMSGVCVCVWRELARHHHIRAGSACAVPMLTYLVFLPAASTVVYMVMPLSDQCISRYLLNLEYM